MTKIIFNQDTFINGYSKFSQDDIAFLEPDIADELVARGVAEYFKEKEPQKKSKKP